MNSMSRRSVVRSFIAAPILSASIRPTNDIGADAQLLTLGSKFVETAAKIDSAIDGGSELTDDLLDRLNSLETDIFAIRATTIDGLRVKARAACWALLGDLDYVDQSSTEKRMAMSIVRDLIRLYDPGLEKPGALKRLVEEIEANAGQSAQDLAGHTGDGRQSQIRFGQ